MNVPKHVLNMILADYPHRFMLNRAYYDEKLRQAKAVHEGLKMYVNVSNAFDDEQLKCIIRLQTESLEMMTVCGFLALGEYRMNQMAYMLFMMKTRGHTCNEAYFEKSVQLLWDHVKFYEEKQFVFTQLRILISVTPITMRPDTADTA